MAPAYKRANPDVRFLDDVEKAGGKPSLNRQPCCQEMVIAAKDLVAAHPDVGRLVFECTNLPTLCNHCSGGHRVAGV